VWWTYAARHVTSGEVSLSVARWREAGGHWGGKEGQNRAHII
jgi:hypothetical protein